MRTCGRPFYAYCTGNGKNRRYCTDRCHAADVKQQRSKIPKVDKTHICVCHSCGHELSLSGQTVPIVPMRVGKKFIVKKRGVKMTTEIKEQSIGITGVRSAADIFPKAAGSSNWPGTHGRYVLVLYPHGRPANGKTK